MKTVYEASNSIEAHMIEHLLEREDIFSRIDGEYLQGGVGEIQASGFIRVLVEDEDYLIATKIISEWESKQPKESPSKPKPKTKTDTLVSSLFGFIAGSALILYLYNTPTTSAEIDNNHDGFADGWYVYVDDRLAKMESDRNFDGEVDQIYYYDFNERVKSMRSDDDFNGTMESRAVFKNGNPFSLATDTNGDGFKDYQENYVDGILDTIELLDSKTKFPIKVMTYKLNKKILSRYDSNGDGVFDIETHFDTFEQIKETIKI